MELLGQHPDLLPRSQFWHIPMFLFGMELSGAGAADLSRRFGWRLLEWPWEPPQAMGRLCRRPMTSSQIAELLEPLNDVALVIFATLSPHVTFKERVELYISNLKGQRSLLNGHDILQAGVASGPDVSVWKHRVLQAQLDGEFSDKEGAMSWLERALAGRDTAELNPARPA